MLRFNLPPTVLALTLLLLLAACSGSKATGTGTGSGTPPNNGPAITELSPSTSTTGSAPQTLTIYGTNFLSTSTVTYNGVMHAATYVSATQLTILLSASDQGVGGNYPVVVTNPPSTNSTAATFEVLNPVPRIDGLSPDDVISGVSAQTITINGDDFVSNSTVTFNGAPITATILSGTQIIMTVTAAQQAVTGSYPVVVTNPGPGGGPSNGENFTVGYPPPVINTLSPNSSLLGSAALTVTINGLNFLSSSTVTYNGVAHAATLVNSTALTIKLTATDQATAGTYNVVVTNPTPGGGASNSEPFSVDNPLATISSISPTSALAGSAPLTLTINGTNFLILSTLKYNGVIHSFNYISSKQITTTLTTTDLQTAGSYPVEVINAAPGGGTSNAVNFSVNNPVPSISSISPSTAQAGGGPGTLNIYGSNFASGATVTLNSVSQTTTYVNAGELTIKLSSTDLATVGTYAVIVTNPAPGGGVSNPVNFQVTNPVPVIVSLEPGSATAGSSGDTFTINGTNFLPESTVSYNGAGHASTYLSSSQISVSLTGGNLKTAGSYPVIVTNPTPGGGASNAFDFTVTKQDAATSNYNFAPPAWQKLGPTTLNGNPSANSVSAIAVSGAEILATLEGVSSVQTFNSGESWSVASGADLRSDAQNQASMVAINPANPFDQYIFSGAGLEYSTDFGQSFSLSGTVPREEWTDTGTANRIAFDSAIPSIGLFAADGGIFESSDFGATWQRTSWPLKSPSVVAVGPDGTIFVGTRGFGEDSGTLSVSHDGGASWTPSQLPTSTRETPTSLSVSPTNPQIVLVGMSGAPILPGGGVLISTDGGATFTAANDGLPAKSGADAPGPFVTSIQFAPEAYPGVAVVTTIDGVYISRPGGAWTDISGNATSRRFQGIACDSGYLYVASYGEGVLRAPIEEIVIP